MMRIHKGHASEKVVVMPIDASVDVAAQFASFDARKARCARDDDHHALLAVIESSFGDLDAFSEKVRRFRAAEPPRVLT